MYANILKRQHCREFKNIISSNVFQIKAKYFDIILYTKNHLFETVIR